MTQTTTLPIDFRRLSRPRILVIFLARPRITYNDVQIGTIGDFKEMVCERKYLDCLKKHYEIKGVKPYHET